jgi:hypothetical protein
VIPPARIMATTLTKSQIDRLKHLSQEFAAIAKEGKKKTAASVTLAEHTEHHSEAAKAVPASRSSKGQRPKVKTGRSYPGET